jgi:sugar fermentation stimulation protein A
MQATPPFLPGHLVQRYKRFLATIMLTTGEEILAHCPNSGAMLGATTPGSPVWVSREAGKNRKLGYTWQLVKIGDSFVGVNTQWPNNLFAEALQEKQLTAFLAYTQWRREVAYGPKTRFDFLLQADSLPDCYVEIKNVHLKRTEHAEFPDCVTLRGAKHLRELAELAQQGFRCVMVYIIQRQDCEAFSFAADLDPTYAAMALAAKQAGVEFMAFRCHVSPQALFIDQEIPVVF